MSSCKVDQCCLVKGAALVAAGAVAGYGLAKVVACKKSKAEAAKKKEKTDSDKIYETDASKNQYIEFHFTPGKTSYARDLKQISEAFDFPLRIAQAFTPYVDSIRKARGGESARIRALDLGCAVGASCFELSKHFDEVIGVDLSSTFIQTANEMKVVKKLTYKAPEQGRLTLDREATLDPAANADNCKFVVGDALNVDKALGTFDAVLAANLLDRVPHPKQLLTNFASLVNKDGILILLSPYSWWEQACDVSEWVGGTDGKRTEDEVKRILGENGFEFVRESDEPFLIRDHTRRYQVGFSHCTVWRRK